MSIGFLLLLLALALLIPTGYAGWIGAPYAPTRALVVKKAFEMLSIGKGDVVVDLGAGDGKILFEASRRGARAYGYELSPIMWAIAWVRALGKKVSIRFGNFYNKKFSDATVIFAFLMPDIMPRVKEWLSHQTIPSGRYFLAYMFPLKDEAPLQIIKAEKCGPIYVYDLKALTAPSKRD